MKRLLFSCLFAVPCLVGSLSAAEVTFDGQISAIFNTKCIKCHQGLIPQAGLRLNNLKNVHKGGKSGKVIVPGNAEASLLYKQFFLPPTSPQHMPPVTDPQLTEGEIALIKAWIEQGAK